MQSTLRYGRTGTAVRRGTAEHIALVGPWHSGMIGTALCGVRVHISETEYRSGAYADTCRSCLRAMRARGLSPAPQAPVDAAPPSGPPVLTIAPPPAERFAHGRDRALVTVDASERLLRLALQSLNQGDTTRTRRLVQAVRDELYAQLITSALSREEGTIVSRRGADAAQSILENRVNA